MATVELLTRLLAVLEAAGELPPQTSSDAWLQRCLENYRRLASRAERVTVHIHHGEGLSDVISVYCLPAYGRLDRAQELGLLLEKKPGEYCYCCSLSRQGTSRHCRGAAS